MMKKIKKKLQRTVLPELTFLLLYGTNLTFRYQVIDENADDSNFSPQPGIYTIWHRHIWVGSFFFRQQNFYTLASPSTDGEFITRVLAKLNYQIVRGSSTRKSLTSMKKLFYLLKKNEKIIITPDGPQGPAKKVKPGLAHLQKRTKAKVYPVGVAVKRKKVFSSWDRFVFPYPFTRVVLVIGKNIDFAEGLTVNERCHLIEEKMVSCNQKAEKILRRDTGKGEIAG